MNATSMVKNPLPLNMFQNNEGVRDLLGKRGIKPEDLPAEEDVKKLRRKVDGDKRKLERESKGFPSEE